MRLRTVLIAVTAVALAAPATPAVAAKKKKPKPVAKVCNLLVDEKGDGTWNLGGGVVKSGSLDIVSADIATGRGEFVATLRLAAPPFDSNDNYSNLGYIWRMGASGNGVRYAFELRRGMGPNPNPISSASVGGVNVPGATHTIVGNTIVWKFKRSAAPALAKPKLVWGDFGANSNVMSSTADSGASEKKYADRAPSCVVAK